MTTQGKWEEVVKIYENDPSTHKARITQTGGTALRVQNDAGYTALHHTASVGSVCMCKCIAKDYSQLISIETKRSETPLYIAVLHGKKDAFLYLHSLCLSSESMASCYSYAKRGRDGSTMLHAAIRREYFDLAYLIIHMYNDLANSVNNEGLAPVHFWPLGHLPSKVVVYKLGIWKGSSITV